MKAHTREPDECYTAMPAEGAQRKGWLLLLGLWKAATVMGHWAGFKGRGTVVERQRKCFRQRDKYIQHLSMTICVLGNGKCLKRK